MNNRVVCVGNVVHDEVFQVDRIPGVGIKVDVRDYQDRYGGPAATAAVAIGRLGGSASYWGRVGSDPAGETAIRIMRDHGVDCANVAVVQGGRTLRSIVIVDRHGERCILSDRNSLPTDMEGLRHASLEDVGVVLVDTRWPQAAELVLARAAAAGIVTVLDADGGSAAVNARLVSMADHVVFSSEGLHDFAGDGEVATLLRRCTARPGQHFAVTRGRAGSLWLIDDEPVPVPAFPVTAIDTTGCGDVFHGAYALGLCEGREPLDAARFATAVAAVKAERGCGWSGMADRPTIDALLAEPARDLAGWM